MPQPSFSRAQRIDPSAWEPLKQRIIELWLADNSLQSVIKTIQAETGFVASESQYRRQLYEVWVVRKYFSGAGLEQIDDKIKQRAAQGKRTTITRYGVEVPINSLQRRTSRRFVSTMDAILAKKDKEANGVGIANGQFLGQASAPFDLNAVKIATPPEVANSPPSSNFETSNVSNKAPNAVELKEKWPEVPKISTSQHKFNFQVGYKDVLRALVELRQWCPGFPFHKYEIFIQCCSALFLDGYYQMVFSSHFSDPDKLDCQVKVILVQETQFLLMDSQIFSKYPDNRIEYSLDSLPPGREKLMRLSLPLRISYSDFRQFWEVWRPPLPIAAAYDTVYPIMTEMVVVNWPRPYGGTPQMANEKAFENARNDFPRALPERVYSSTTLSELMRRQILPHGDQTGSILRKILDTFFSRIDHISNASWMMAIRLAIRHELPEIATKFIRELERRGRVLDYRAVLEATYWLSSRSNPLFQPRSIILPTLLSSYNEGLFDLIYKTKGNIGPDEAESLLLVTSAFKFEKGIKAFSRCVSKDALERVSKLVH